MCLYTASTKLFATRESALAKKPRLRLITVRSSSVRPFGSLHKARSAVILISCGIQWLAQPSKYFCHAQSYLKGTSWFKSARQLMIFLSSTWMREAPISISSKPVPLKSVPASLSAFMIIGSIIGLTCGAAPAVAMSCSFVTKPSPACGVFSTGSR